MSEESHPSKRHKPIDTSNDTELEESKPILGAQIPTQLVNPIGDETKLMKNPLKGFSWTQLTKRSLMTI
jgi:hypothetical protein